MQRRLSEFLTPEVAAKCSLTSPLPPHELLNRISVSDLQYDSRRIQPGWAYFALRGLHADGHDYIDAAIDKGATVVIHDRELPQKREGVLYLQVADSRFAMSPFAAAFHGEPSRRLGVIGVTGTEGKSTTVYLIYQLLELAGRRAGFISTVQYRIGEREEWNPEHQTTPEAVTIHKHLASMREAGFDFAVVEASSHGLSPRTNRLGDVAFDVAVMTNVTHEHLEFHGTWEQYRDDKAKLFRSLDCVNHEKGESLGRIPSFTVINADDPSAAFFSGACERRAYTFSMQGAEADLSIRNLESGSNGNRYEIFCRADGSTISVQDSLPGAFNAANVLAALLVVAGLLDRPVSELAALVGKLSPVRGRMTPVSCGQPFEVLVDYAHTPSSFQAVLPPLAQRIHADGKRLIAVFGSGGERDVLKRPLQGKAAAQHCDVVILADEDPRGEDPLALLEQIAEGCSELERGSRLFLIPDRAQAIRKAFSLACEGDAVILLGKGHENTIIYADRVMAWDEISTAERILVDMGYGDRE